MIFDAIQKQDSVKMHLHLEELQLYLQIFIKKQKKPPHNFMECIYNSFSFKQNMMIFMEDIKRLKKRSKQKSQILTRLNHKFRPKRLVKTHEHKQLMLRFIKKLQSNSKIIWIFKIWIFQKPSLLRIQALNLSLRTSLIPLKN